MGSGPEVVVDEQLRVRGLRGFRLVDASVTPGVTNGTNAPAITIAEKAADLIRGKRLSPSNAPYSKHLLVGSRAAAK